MASSSPSDDDYKLEYYEVEEQRHSENRFLGNALRKDLTNIRKRLKVVDRRLQCFFVTFCIVCAATIAFVLFVNFKPFMESGNRKNSPEDLKDPRTVILSTDCNEGWFDGNFVDMGCLHLETTMMSHSNATTLCETMNASLLEVHTQPQMEVIVNMLKVVEPFLGRSTWWTGGSNLGHEDEWRWTTSKLPVGRFVWGAGQPGGQVDHNYLCLSYKDEYLGGDCYNNCTWGHPICQKKY